MDQELRDAVVLIEEGKWRDEHEKALEVALAQPASDSKDLIVEVLQRLKSGRPIRYATLQELNADRLDESQLNAFWQLLVTANQTDEQRQAAYAQSVGEPAELTEASRDSLRRAFRAISDVAVSRRPQ